MKLRLDLDNFDACPRYNDWIDEQYADQSGALSILSFQPRPSFVLFSLSQDTYQAAFADFQNEWQEQLKQNVYTEFPSPIAYYFYRFENGHENALQKLHFLRDTWEAIIDVMHAIVVAECRFRKVTLPQRILFSHILDDSVAQRLLNVERILDHCYNSGIEMSISQIAKTSTLATMRELNHSRNGFSHSAAQSEAQALAWVSECYEDVIDVLDSLRGLANLKILRYVGQEDGTTLRCEVFKGHGFTKTICNVALSPEQDRESRFFQKGQLLLLNMRSIFGLRPLVYFREDPSGHTTKLCMFRKTKGKAPNRRIEYEVVGDAERHEEDRAKFRVELDEIRALFGLGPD